MLLRCKMIEFDQVDSILNPSRPISSHRHRGLKNFQDKEEHISIRDLDTQHICAPAESSHGILWHVPFPEHSARQWSRTTETSSVHLTRPYSHSLSAVALILGKLAPESIALLTTLFREFFENASDLTPTAATQGPTFESEKRESSSVRHK